MPEKRQKECFLDINIERIAESQKVYYLNHILLAVIRCKTDLKQYFETFLGT